VTVLLCALPQEEKPLREIPVVLSGQARLICGGVGPHNAERATRELLAHTKPSLVLSTGVAGALSPALRVADIVVANEVIEQATGTRFACTLPSGIQHPASSILSVARMITTVEEKQSLARQFGAVAVDMESAAIARACAEHGVPFACVRAISDTADEVLPEAVTRFFDADGKLRPGRVLAESVKQPSLLAELHRLRRQTNVAAERLRAFLETCTIPP
jgi:adenosylhomocysteine nucleosidase